MTGDLLARWDTQQAAYIARREERFAVMLDILELGSGAPATVVDLACGPGSLALRVLDRFPGARVVGVDHDPVLLRLAASQVDDRVALVDADLAAGAWPAAVLQALGGAAPDAILSTTALHWLWPDALLRVYRQCHDLLAPGGVLMNGDHLRFDLRHPTLHRVAEAHDAATQRAAFAAGAPAWDAWWDEAHELPEGEALAAERARRYPDRGPTPPTTVGFHLAALRQAGLTEVAPVWQLLDDYVVFGRKAA